MAGSTRLRAPEQSDYSDLLALKHIQIYILMQGVAAQLCKNFSILVIVPSVDTYTHQ